MTETEIQQIKQEYITDRIRESIDVFSNQPERFGTILMCAVAVLAILISKVLPKLVMPAEATAYPKLYKIYKELKRQNEIIFEAEKERKNEEIDILKIGLSGIAKRYGYQNVQEFYRTYNKSHSAYIAYKEQVAECEKTYGDDNQKQNKESVLERLKNPPKRTAAYQQQRTLTGKDQRVM